MPTSPPADDRDAVPDYVVVGHLARDLTPGGARLGGTAAYAALAAHRLGCRVGIVTSHGPDLDPRGPLEGIPMKVVEAGASTTFENIYEAGGRRQLVRDVATPLTLDDIPEAWKRAPVLHLAPILGEVAPELLGQLDGVAIRGITPQGWMRRVDPQGRVRPWSGGPAPRGGHVVIFSEEDVAGAEDEAVGRFGDGAPIVVVTRGPAGATLYHRGRSHGCPAFEAIDVDPTGAGDVFAAAFLVHLWRTGDPLAAARFANAVASLAVEAEGLGGIPTLARVRARLRTRPEPIPDGHDRHRIPSPDRNHL